MIHPLTNQLIDKLCPSDFRHFLENLLSSCFEFPATDRVQLAVLRGTSWDLEKIRKNILLANSDWRDLLVQADFAEDLNEHENWQKNAIKYSSIDV